LRSIVSAQTETFQSYGWSVPQLKGDADVAKVASLLADDARARILMTLGDGRALPASLLASEAGVAPSTASEHLRKLADGGLVTVHPQGRHRYYRLAGPEVAAAWEALSHVAPPFEVKSLKQATRAEALRRARSCYDHLAGRLGVSVFAALIDDGGVTGGDGIHRLDSDGEDRLSAPGRDVNYELVARGADRLARLGVALPAPHGDSIPLRYCIDWTEQRHHMSGVVGRNLLAWLLEVAWLERDAKTRALRTTEAGEKGLKKAFGTAVLS
jgi:DNA-binding transcriptional ArsR family regulator